MLDCEKIYEIDFAYFKNINTIGASFLRGCKSLEKLNLNGFDNVTVIPNSFLVDC
ncbi:MAG: hypothetical protein HUJ68_11055 [Clostridia bacterium]|nr:hypothetical protein [Clostridia bacterium]